MPSSNNTPTPAHEYAQKNRDRFLQELIDLIAIPSVSTQPEHTADVQAAADRITADLRRIGLHAEQITAEGGRHPLVYGHYHAADDAPTVLIYSHYDIQPAEIADGWDSDPFTPVQRDGKIYARGSTDSKINLMAQLKAAESLFATHNGRPPLNLKFIFEGEEESGSETIERVLAAQPDKFTADIGVICDGSIVQPDQPSLICGVRGVLTTEFRVTGPARDLHSGHYGGAVHNPLQALAEIIAQLHDEDGRVTVPGFYDNVRTFTADERAKLAVIDPIFEDAWRTIADAPRPWGEPGYSLHERIGIRPTLEINGLTGGYTGDGFKTVLPARAMAKISCRLVADQQPGRIFGLLHDHLQALTPDTVESELIRMEMGAPATLIELDSPAVDLAARAYAAHWPNPTILEMAGGSVPIAYAIQPLVDQMVLIGYTHKGGRAHGPNEHIYIENYHRGVAAALTFLQGAGEAVGR